MLFSLVQKLKQKFLPQLEILQYSEDNWKLGDITEKFMFEMAYLHAEQKPEDRTVEVQKRE